jgi:hypothetical protein
MSVRESSRVARVHRLIVAAIVSLGAAVAAAGCGSSSGGCKDVPIGINNSVASSLATGFTVDGFKAVRSSDKKVWFVSAQGTDPSGNPIYPTWATTDLSNSSGLKDVDATSRNVSPMLGSMPGVSADDSAAAKARDCARKAASGS